MPAYNCSYPGARRCFFRNVLVFPIGRGKYVAKHAILNNIMCHGYRTGTGATVRETRTSPTTSERKLTSYDTAVYDNGYNHTIMARTYTYKHPADTPPPVASPRTTTTTTMSRSLKMAIFHTGFDTAPPPPSEERNGHHRDNPGHVPSTIYLDAIAVPR